MFFSEGNRSNLQSNNQEHRLVAADLLELRVASLVRARAAKLAINVAVLCILTLAARGADWPQLRGPNHDGASSEHILTNWPAGGLRQIWKRPLTGGFSSITVGEQKAFTLVKRELDGASQEFCVALDANTGNELWATPIGAAKYDGGGNTGAPGYEGGDGPRSTPSYDNGKVYTYSSHMVLQCLDAKSGKQIWYCDILKDHAGHNIQWQSALSPLVDGNLVLVAGGGPGEALLAFDKNDGRVVWKGQDDLMTHTSPLATDLLGRRQVIFFTQKGLVSVAPETGAVLWRFPFRFDTATEASPVVCGDIVYCSAAYGGIGAGACRISRADSEFTATEIWHKPQNVMASQWTTPVAKDGYIYAISGIGKFLVAPLICIEASTGNILWSQPGFGNGGCTLVGDNILVLSEAGDLVLVKATPSGYRELSRSHHLDGKCWNSASISNGRIYARSTREGVCLDISLTKASDAK